MFYSLVDGDFFLSSEVSFSFVSMKNCSQCSCDPFAPALPTSGVSTLLHSNAWTSQIIFFIFLTDSVMIATVNTSLGIAGFFGDLYFWFPVVFCLRILYPNAI